MAKVALTKDQSIRHMKDASESWMLIGELEEIDRIKMKADEK